MLPQKSMVFTSKVKSVRLNGSETWRLTKGLSAFPSGEACKIKIPPGIGVINKRERIGRNHNFNAMEVEMDWPYLEEEESGHYKNGHNMGFRSRKKESGRTETVTETNNDKRAGEHLEDMG